jgi:ribosomal protein L19E
VIAKYFRERAGRKLESRIRKTMRKAGPGTTEMIQKGFWNESSYQVRKALEQMETDGVIVKGDYELWELVDENG